MNRSSSDEPASSRVPLVGATSDHGSQLDSYLAPSSLAAARRQVSRRVEAFLANMNAQSNTSEAAAGVVRIGDGTPSEELANISSGNAGCVVADFVLWHPQWDEQNCSELSDLLRPGGRIVFLEPVATFGWRRSFHRRTQSRLRDRLGYDFEKDVPADLRRSGITPITVDRFDLKRTRSYVWGEARHL